MAAELPTPPLTLPPDQMRQLGYQVVDLVVDALDGLRDRPPSRRARPEELAGLLNEPLPRAGPTPRRCSGRPSGSTIRASSPTCRSPATTLACWPTPSPRGSGCSRGPGRRPRARARPSWPRSAGCGSCSGCPRRPAGCSWTAAPRPTCTGWSRPGGRSSGTGWRGRCCTPRPDPLLDRPGRRARRAAAVPGAPAGKRRRVPSAPGRGGRGRGRRPGRRAAAVLRGRDLGHDQHRQRRPAGRAGRAVPGRGAVVPRRRRLRGPGILSSGGRELLAGIEQADSLALDAHKWLFQPLEAGCVLVRDVGLLESIFSTSREFLLDAAAGEREVNFTDRGLQLTRGFRAFKLWLSLKVFGLDAFAAAVQHGMDLAGYADALLRRRAGWEVVAPTRLALVSFCYADGSRTPAELEAVNRRVADAMLVDELATLSSTVLGGRTVLLLCTINH